MDCETLLSETYRIVCVVDVNKLIPTYYEIFDTEIFSRYMNGLLTSESSYVGSIVQWYFRAEKSSRWGIFNKRGHNKPNNCNSRQILYIWSKIL